MNLAHLRGELTQHAKEVVSRDRQAEDLAQLIGDDDKSDAVEVADEDRYR